jgi:hypothetical protein
MRASDHFRFELGSLRRRSDDRCDKSALKDPRNGLLEALGDVIGGRPRCFIVPGRAKPAGHQHRFASRGARGDYVPIRLITNHVERFRRETASLAIELLDSLCRLSHALDEISDTAV